MERQKHIQYALTALFTLFLLGLGVITVALFKSSPAPTLPVVSVSATPTPLLLPKDIEAFRTEEEFKTYLTASYDVYKGPYGWAGSMIETGILEQAPLATNGAARATGFGAGKGAPDRVSTTTVQVKGIDEPDLVKTDGSVIYLSSGSPAYYPGMERKMLTEGTPASLQGETRTIQAFPPENLSVLTRLENGGDLLLTAGVQLIVIASDFIYGYDVAHPSESTQRWKLKLDGDTQIVEARLYQDQLYLITSTPIDSDHPCPLKILSRDEAPFTIVCNQIHHPKTPILVDVTYTILRVDPYTGQIIDSLSLIGSSYSSVVYMSPNALYITFLYYQDMFGLYDNFLNQMAADILPSSVLEKIKRLKQYDLSRRSKMTELAWILEQFQNSLSDDERSQVEDKLSQRMEDYLKESTRQLEQTGLVKISLTQFRILASASVPGALLNQFSLDEYQGYLRVATTVGEGVLGQTESANDLYILDDNLEVTGSVYDLGLTERIYAVRFVDDKGYVVTFRETDPFYVLDLSDPSWPTLAGELKIPGYSSYLHPIDKDRLVGVGKEGGRVKLSLFDVSAPTQPIELDRYILNEQWSDVLETHHAFLLDRKHQIFYLPAAQAGYIFSYQGNKLQQKKVIKNIEAKRGLYINDYLYVVAENKVIVLNETDWTEVNQLSW